MQPAKPLKGIRPVVLCILDGWGERKDAPDNAISAAKTPVWHRLMKDAPHAHIATSGLAVGLPAGQMGNSEVGHMNIGAGRVVMQDLPRIDAAIKDGSFEKNAVLAGFVAKLKDSRSACHLMGLVSPGGVHSHQNHIAVLARHLDKAGIPVVIHAFLDGRDTPPQSALGFVAKLEDDIRGTRSVRIATVSGRYYAMDRDKRWDRTKRAYDAIVSADAPKAAFPEAAIKASYEAGKGDEFVEPRVIADYTGMTDGDGILMANFRADRVRQILTALVEPGFDAFAREKTIAFSAAAGMTEYSDALAKRLSTLFPPDPLDETLGQFVAEHHLKQLRIAETEKYAHVTFFLNGGREQVFDGEERILVPSPKVATYDLQPEMSAKPVTEKLVEAIESGRFDLIVANFANPDMVGHTGILPAAIKAVETIDWALGQIEAALVKVGGVMAVTADHGNIEMMRDPKTGEPYTAHTTFEVPLVLVNARALERPVSLENGRLADIAPTILALMGLAKPAAMSGHSLLEVPGERRDAPHASHRPT